MSIPPFSILHFGGTYPNGWLYSDWRPTPTVVLGIFALIAAYLWWTGPKNRTADGQQINPVSGGQRVAFVAGSIVMLIALNPPLDDWAGAYLLTAHMFQHMLLIFLTAPLWLLGMPTWLLRQLTRPRPIRQIGYVLTRPVVAFALSSMIITFWHLPVGYNAALNSNPVHVVQHFSFLFAALLGWWPVLGVLEEWPRLSPPLRCIFLFVSGMPGAIVGSFVTLAEPGLYSHYTQSPRIFGITLAMDQQIAGLMMWVLTNVIYLLTLTVIFFRWAAKEDAKETRPVTRSAPATADSAALLDSSTSSLPS